MNKLTISELKNTLVNETNSQLESSVREFSSTLSANTKRAYMTDITTFFGVDSTANITEQMVKSVTVETANIWFDNMVSAGLSNATINRRMNALSKFYQFLCQERIGIMTYNPFSGKEGAKRFKGTNDSLTRCLTVGEVKSIISVLDNDKSLQGKRNKAIIFLLYSAGLRRSEVAKIKVGDFGYSQGQFTLRIKGKGSREDILQIDDTVMDTVNDYMIEKNVDINDKDSHLFTSCSTNGLDKGKCLTGEAIRLIVKKVSKEADLDESTISPHSLRHTFVTELIKEYGIENTQLLARHSDISTTRIYDHATNVLEQKASSVLLSKLENN